MELRQLRSVEAVARHRHFTRAAEELHLAQSALSHQIRRLEQELGTPLFERTSRRVTPTEAGQAIAARARRVLAEVDAAREEVDELRGVLRGRDLDRGAPARRRPRRSRAARPLQPSAPGHRGRAPRGHRRRHAPLSGRRRARRRLLPAGRRDSRRARRRATEPTRRWSPPSLPTAPHRLRTSASPTSPSTRSSRPAAARPSPPSSDELFADAGQPLRLALESGDPFLLRSLAARGFATAILPRSLTALEGPGRRGAKPAPRRPSARGARLAPRAQRAARGTHVHRVRPLPEHKRRRSDQPRPPRVPVGDL